MKFPAFPFLLPLAAVLALSASSHGQTPATDKATAADKPKPMAAQDKKFIKDAGDSLFYELKIAEIGKKTTKDEGVKRVCELVNDDGNKIWAELAEHAEAAGEKLPIDVSGGDKSAVGRLEKMKDERFDKQVLKDLGKESKKLAQMFETASKSQSSTLKSFAEKWMLAVKNHATEADKAEAEVGKRK